MQRKEALVSGEIYHIFNRGVEKREIFSDRADYKRFISSLAEFNTFSPIELRHVRANHPSEVRPPKDRSEEIVSILAYTLLPNHFHLLLRQESENGITEFMRKIGTGYTMFFNLKSDRVGPLFQGRFKSVHISDEAQFQYIPHYVHLNVLDVLSSGWKESGIKVETALKLLKKYEWSSAREYAGVSPKESILNRKVIEEIFGSELVNTKILKELLENPT